MASDLRLAAWKGMNNLESLQVKLYIIYIYACPWVATLIPTQPLHKEKPVPGIALHIPLSTVLNLLRNMTVWRETLWSKNSFDWLLGHMIKNRHVKAEHFCCRDNSKYSKSDDIIIKPEANLHNRRGKRRFR